MGSDYKLGLTLAVRRWRSRLSADWSLRRTKLAQIWSQKRWQTCRETLQISSAHNRCKIWQETFWSQTEDLLPNGECVEWVWVWVESCSGAGWRHESLRRLRSEPDRGAFQNSSAGVSGQKNRDAATVKYHCAGLSCCGWLPGLC